MNRAALAAIKASTSCFEKNARYRAPRATTVKCPRRTSSRTPEVPLKPIKRATSSMATRSASSRSTVCGLRCPEVGAGRQRHRLDAGRRSRRCLPLRRDRLRPSRPSRGDLVAVGPRAFRTGRGGGMWFWMDLPGPNQQSTPRRSHFSSGGHFPAGDIGDPFRMNGMGFGCGINVPLRRSAGVPNQFFNRKQGRSRHHLPGPPKSPPPALVIVSGLAGDVAVHPVGAN